MVIVERSNTEILEQIRACEKLLHEAITTEGNRLYGCFGKGCGIDQTARIILATSALLVKSTGEFAVKIASQSETGRTGDLYNYVMDRFLFTVADEAYSPEGLMIDGLESVANLGANDESEVWEFENYISPLKRQLIREVEGYEVAPEEDVGYQLDSAVGKAQLAVASAIRNR